MLFSTKVTAIILSIILFGTGFWWYRKNQPVQEPVAPEITLEPSRQIETRLQEPMSEAEKQTVDDKFAQNGSEMILLKDLAEGQSVGTAWRLFDGQKFYHKIDASNLPSPDKGYYYEAWLVGQEGFFSTGRLAELNGKGELYYTNDEDKGGYRGVVVTFEPEDGDPAPAKTILEGSF